MNTQNDESQKSNIRLGLWLSFLKFFLGSVVVTLVSLKVNSNLKKRELEREELKLIGTYIDYALTQDVGNRKRFSEYFATVIRSDEQRVRWKAYDDLVSIEYRKELQKKDSLIHRQDSMNVAIALEAKQKENKILQNSSKDMMSTEEREKIRKEIETEYESKLNEIRNQLNVSQTRLQVTPINKDPIDYSDEIIDYKALKCSKLAVLTLRFLSENYKDCFSAIKIKEISNSQPKFKALSTYSNESIERTLASLKFYGLIEQGTCTIESLYSVSNPNSPEIKKFKE